MFRRMAESYLLLKVGSTLNWITLNIDRPTNKVVMLLRDFTPRFVGPSVRRSVRPNAPLTSIMVHVPLARDRSSCVSGFVSQDLMIIDFYHLVRSVYCGKTLGCDSNMECFWHFLCRHL